MNAMDWLMDYQDCLEGEHGEWWADRALRVIQDEDLPTDGTAWKRWRTIRQIERGPQQ